MEPDRRPDGLLVLVQGLKSGGWTTRLSFPNSRRPPRFGPEKAQDLRSGIKSEFFDHRLRVNLAGFRTNYLGIQQNAFIFISPTIRIPATRHYGSEAEGQAVMTDDFIVSASVGCPHARYTRLAATVGDATLAGGRTVTLSSALRKTPNGSSDLGPQYTIDMDTVPARSSSTWITRAQRSVQNDTENTVELLRPAYQPAQCLRDLQGGNGHWEAGGGWNQSHRRPLYRQRQRPTRRRQHIRLLQRATSMVRHGAAEVLKACKSDRA